MQRINPKDMLTPEAQNSFLPCRTCSNIMTKECWDDCTFWNNYKHYRQRPDTDIKDLAPFPLQKVLHDQDANQRLLTIGIYLTAITNFLQHMEEYEKIRVYCKKNGTKPEDYSI